MNGDSKYNEFFSLVAQTYSDVIGVDNTWRKHQECICIIQDMCEKIYKVHHNDQDSIQQDPEEENNDIDPTLDKFDYYFDGEKFYIKSCHNCGNSGDDCSQYLCCVDWELEEEEEGELCDPVFVPEEEAEPSTEVKNTGVDNSPPVDTSPAEGGEKFELFINQGESLFTRCPGELAVMKSCANCLHVDKCLYSGLSIKNSENQYNERYYCRAWLPTATGSVNKGGTGEATQALKSGEAVAKNGGVIYKSCDNCAKEEFCEAAGSRLLGKDYCEDWKYGPPPDLENEGSDSYYIKGIGDISKSCFNCLRNGLGECCGGQGGDYCDGWVFDPNMGGIYERSDEEI